MTALLLILLATVLIVLGVTALWGWAYRTDCLRAEHAHAEARVDLDEALTALAAERQARQAAHREQRQLHAALARAEAKARILHRQLTASAALDPDALPDQDLHTCRQIWAASGPDTPGGDR